MERILVLLSEMLHKFDVLAGRVDNLTSRVDNLTSTVDQRLSKVEGEIVKLNLISAENSRALLNWATTMIDYFGLKMQCLNKL